MQDIAVFIIVALAAIYLVRGWFLASRGGGCASGCGGCSSTKEKSVEAPLVQIELGGSFKRSGEKSHLN